MPPKKDKENRTIVKRTRKKGVEIILPGTQTILYQSNRVTNGRNSLSLYQWKVLACTMKELQEPIKYSMQGKDYLQLPLFAENAIGDVISEPVIFREQKDSKIVRIALTLSDITTPNHYQHAIAAATALQQYRIVLKSTEHKGYNDSNVLFTRVSTPEKLNGSLAIYVEMYRDVAKLLIEVDKNEKGKPVQFTKYIYEIIKHASSKFTPILYQKISSWKVNGGFFITYENLRKDLGIADDEYSNYADFKKRVLVPVQKELEKRADCWFNCRARDFEERRGRKVIGLNFKVITPEFEEAQRVQADNIRDMLRRHLHFKEEHMLKIAPLIHSETDFMRLGVKIIDLVDHLKNKGVDSQGNIIMDPQSYAIVALREAFSV
jgi:hypothetical protein